MSQSNEPLPVWFLFALAWARAAFTSELGEMGAHPGDHPGQIQADLAKSLFGQQIQAPCPQCRRDILAQIQPTAPELRIPVGRYHPWQCSYLRALIVDLLDLVSRDPALLQTWHEQAVRRYAKSRR